MVKKNRSNTGKRRKHGKDMKKRKRHGIEVSKGIDYQIDRLQASKFRFLNEKFYERTGKDMHKLLKDDPELFEIYHKGFEQQRQKWPQDPLEMVAKFLRGRFAKGKECLVCDLGCGDARLKRELLKEHERFTVSSYDLVATNDDVIECDMTKLPQEKESQDCCIFSLSLMGTNHYEYLLEASRVLKKKGLLIICELESRLPKWKTFIDKVERYLGMKLVLKNLYDYFHFYVFEKVKPAKPHPPNVPLLLPTLYKKR